MAAWLALKKHISNGAAMTDFSADAALPFSKKTTCAITGKERSRKDLVNIDTLRPALTDRIRRDFPDLPAEEIGRAHV